MITRRSSAGLAAALLLSACAALDVPRRELIPVQVRVAGHERSLRFQSVHAGQVVVAGIWTVIFRVDERDVPWLRDVAEQQGTAKLVWHGRVVWEFDPATDGSGYFRDRGFRDEATARRVAGEILDAQGPVADPAAQSGSAAGGASRGGSAAVHDQADAWKTSSGVPSPWQ